MARTAEYRGDPSSIHPRHVVTTLERGMIRFARRYTAAPSNADLGVFNMAKEVSVAGVDSIVVGPVDFITAREFHRGLVAATQVVEEKQEPPKY